MVIGALAGVLFDLLEEDGDDGDEHVDEDHRLEDVEQEEQPGRFKQCPFHK